MREDVKKAWVEALRSGQYNQTHTWPKKYVDGVCYHCALGVLCELVREEFKLVEQFVFAGHANFTKCQFENANTGIPEDVASSLGLSSDDESNIIVMNDSERKSFEEIADYIEQNM